MKVLHGRKFRPWSEMLERGVHLGLEIAHQVMDVPILIGAGLPLERPDLEQPDRWPPGGVLQADIPHGGGVARDSAWAMAVMILAWSGLKPPWSSSV